MRCRRGGSPGYQVQRGAPTGVASESESGIRRPGSAGSGCPFGGKGEKRMEGERGAAVWVAGPCRQHPGLGDQTRSGEGWVTYLPSVSLTIVGRASGDVGVVTHLGRCTVAYRQIATAHLEVCSSRGSDPPEDDQRRHRDYGSPMHGFTTMSSSLVWNKLPDITTIVQKNRKLDTWTLSDYTRPPCPGTGSRIHLPNPGVHDER